MLTKTQLATFVASVCLSQFTLAENATQNSKNQSTNQLEQISVVEVETSDTLVNTAVNRKDMLLRQVRDVKDLFAYKMDVNVSQLQGTRSGGEGVNIRGLQGNRVTTTVDGIPLPEAQEAKHFISYGVEYGRGDYVDVSGLRSANVQYAGSANSLSGSVNFATLEPVDILKGKNVGGFVGTGYDSVDNSLYGSVGGAVKVGDYQGMLMTTLRKGHETKNQGSNGGIGDTRTEPNPLDYRGNYVLTKHYYQLNDKNRVGATFEYQRRKTNSDLLHLNGASIDSGTGKQVSGDTNDRVSRTRFSISHDYNSETGWVQNAKTQIYYQDSKTDNHRFRQGDKNYRLENAEMTHKTYGINSHLMTYLDGNIPQVLRYGFTYNYTKAENNLYYERPGYATPPLNQFGQAIFNGKPTADTKQHKVTGYFEDEIAFGNLVITPQVGFVYYRVTPTSEGNIIKDFSAQKRAERKFTPKLSIEYRFAPEFIPYVQYSRGVRTPSPQQLTSFFHESPLPTVNVAVVGNPNLRSEVADNFELGIKGENSSLQYLVTGYYNRYSNFIDWVTKRKQMPPQPIDWLIQYDNLEKAKVYGFTADAKWNVYNDFYTNGGVAYARGRATNNGIKTPINSIQPLKLRLGFGYEGEQFGATVQWSYTRGKADKDIDQLSGKFYNPTGGYSLVDLGVYWRPVENLTFTANINNLFDKKYWNWNEISYLALFDKAGADTGRPIPVSIDAQNADRYSAPGRNFNIGVRYEF